jgi:hypothetical protein
MLSWVDPRGKQRLWECAERTTRKGSIDAVGIAARVIDASSGAQSFVVVKQVWLLYQ